MNGKKNIIIFLLIMAMASTIVLAIVIAIRKIDKENYFGVSITYMNTIKTFDDIITFACYGETMSEKENADTRITLGFADASPFLKYIEEIGEDVENFLIKKGYVYLYYQFHDIKYYLLQNKIEDGVEWNLVILDGSNNRIVRLADIKYKNDVQEGYSNLSFAKKVEQRDSKVYFYLNDGIFVLDEKDNIDIFECNLIKIFTKIEEENNNLKINGSKISYIDNKLYVLCQTLNDNKHCIISFNINTNTFDIIPTSHTAHNIEVIDNKVIVISTDDRKVYIETYNENSKSYMPITFIGNNKKTDIIDVDTSCKTIVFKNRLFISLLKDSDTEKQSIFTFTVDTKTFAVKEFMEYEINNSEYFFYGIILFVK